MSGRDWKFKMLMKPWNCCTWGMNEMIVEFGTYFMSLLQSKEIEIDKFDIYACYCYFQQSQIWTHGKGLPLCSELCEVANSNLDSKCTNTIRYWKVCSIHVDTFLSSRVVVWWYQRKTYYPCRYEQTHWETHWLFLAVWRFELQLNYWFISSSTKILSFHL